MSEPQRHNGLRDVSRGAERIRSGFDRGKYWAESIKSAYRRMDHRLSELFQQGMEKGRALKTDAEAYIERNSVPLLGLCFAAGILIGLRLAKRGEEEE